MPESIPIAATDAQIAAVTFNEDGLVPAIVQEQGTGQVLMMAWMNADSLRTSLETGRTFNLVVINALRASGDARFPVLAGAASMLIVLAGGSWFLGVHLGLGLTGLWIAYAADEWIRGLLMWRRWATLGWVPSARAAHRRLRRSAQ